ncbi:MAG: hypothetical protein IT204_06045 [Fimbriimonadaceae bacterium]|nr:hypothetical protein [Fimbriimonadaceae bacterium]
MRACVEAMVEPLPSAVAAPAAAPVAPLHGLPTWQPVVLDPWSAGLEVLLRQAGRCVTEADLAVWSGLAWQLAWHRGVPCCHSNLYVLPQEPLTLLANQAGVTLRRRLRQPWAALLRSLRQQLRSGRPVLTAGVPAAGDWSLVGGLGEAGWRHSAWPGEPPTPLAELWLRTPDDRGPALRPHSQTAWAGWWPGPAATVWARLPLLWVESVQARPAEQPAAVLRQAVAVLQARDDGPYALGQAAYQAAVAHLEAAADWAAAPVSELSRQAWALFYTARRTAAARGLAASWCDRAAGQAAGAAGRLLALTARELDEVAAAWRTAAHRWPAQDAGRCAAWLDPAHRAALASDLRRARRREAAATEHLRRAADRLA